MTTELFLAGNEDKTLIEAEVSQRGRLEHTSHKSLICHHGIHQRTLQNKVVKVLTKHASLLLKSITLEDERVSNVALTFKKGCWALPRNYSTVSTTPGQQVTMATSTGELQEHEIKTNQPTSLTINSLHLTRKL